MFIFERWAMRRPPKVWDKKGFDFPAFSFVFLRINLLKTLRDREFTEETKTLKNEEIKYAFDARAFDGDGKPSRFGTGSYDYVESRLDLD